MKSSLKKLNLLAVAVLAGSIGNAFAASEIEGGATTTGAPMSSSLAPVTQAMLDASEGDKNSWLQSNIDYANSRYFDGDQISTSNVAKLKPAFVFQTEVRESMETAPIVVNGVMFLTTSYDHVYAIDATTGKEFWHYTHKMGPVTTYCCGPNNRGVAITEGSALSWARSTPSWSRSTRRPARCSGDARSPIPKRATPRRWRRSSSTTRC